MTLQLADEWQQEPIGRSTAPVFATQKLYYADAASSGTVAKSIFDIYYL